MSSMEISNLTKEKIEKMFSEGNRFDSRKLTDFRDFIIEKNISNTAEGSTRVKLGKTEVLVGVKMLVGEPYPDSPDKGNLSVSADLLPLASPRFESGPPQFDAIELPRLVDRIIRHSGILELEKLVIKEGEKVWTIAIDIYPINDDGNLIVAATLGAVVALRNSFLPSLDKNDRPDYEDRTKTHLPINKEVIPMCFSFYKLGNSLVLDPTREEEEACDTKITFGISKIGDEHRINSCQKKGKEIFTSEEVTQMMDIITKKFDELNKKLKNFL